MFVYNFAISEMSSPLWLILDFSRQQKLAHTLFAMHHILHFKENISLKTSFPIQVHNAARDVPAGGPGLHSVPHDSQVRLVRQEQA